MKRLSDEEISKVIAERRKEHRHKYLFDAVKSGLTDEEAEALYNRYGTGDPEGLPYPHDLDGEGRIYWGVVREGPEGDLYPDGRLTLDEVRWLIEADDEEAYLLLEEAAERDTPGTLTYQLPPKVRAEGRGHFFPTQVCEHCEEEELPWNSAYELCESCLDQVEGAL